MPTSGVRDWSGHAGKAGIASNGIASDAVPARRLNRPIDTFEVRTRTL
jgi:hypothetical protein